MTRRESRICSAATRLMPKACGSTSPARTTAARAGGYGKRWMVEPIGGGAYRYAPSKAGVVVVVDGVG